MIYWLLLLVPVVCLGQPAPPFNPPSGSGVAIACVGTPGNTHGSYRQQCQTSAGAIYACNNSLGCAVSSDWVVVGGSSVPGTSGQYTIANGTGGFGTSLTPNTPNGPLQLDSGGNITGPITTSSSLGGVTLSGLSGIIRLLAGIPSVASDVPTCTKYTVTTSAGNWTVTGQSAQAISAATSQTITIASLPAFYQITGLRVKQSTSFSGTSITAMTVSLGSNSTGNTSVFAPPFDVFQGVSTTAFWDDGGAFAAVSSSDTLTATFVSTGANLNAISAGSVDIWACVRTLP